MSNKSMHTLPVGEKTGLKILFISLGGVSPNATAPLGILYLASIAQMKGCVVEFYDASFTYNNVGQFLKYLNRLKARKGFVPDVCGFTLFTVNVLDCYKFAETIKKEIPRCKIIVGGPHATALPERTMQECVLIDYLVYGEGEVTFAELLNAVNNRKSLKTVNGIYYRINKEIANTPPRKYIEDLDSIPFPAFDLLPKDYPYKLYDALNVGNVGAPIITSRGCPFECTFCFKATFGTRYRRRSPKNIVAEMKHLIENFGINNIFFEDDFFAVDKSWLEDFYQELKKNKIRVPWRCQGRVNTLSKEDYIKMKENGCYHITFGVEAGNDEVLKDIKKNITVRQTIKTFNDVKKSGLMVMGNFIFGHRKDTYFTINETLKLAKKVNPDTVSFLCLAPIPGSQVYSYLPGDLKYDWDKHGSYFGNSSKLPLSICEVRAEDLYSFLKQAHIKFYGRFKYLWENVLLPRNAHKPFRKMKLLYWMENIYLPWKIKLVKYRILKKIFKKIKKILYLICKKGMNTSPKEKRQRKIALGIFF